jgi:hypothetical protein
MKFFRIFLCALAGFTWGSVSQAGMDSNGRIYGDFPVTGLATETIWNGQGITNPSYYNFGLVTTDLWVEIGPAAYGDPGQLALLDIGVGGTPQATPLPPYPGSGENLISPPQGDISPPQGDIISLGTSDFEYHIGQDSIQVTIDDPGGQFLVNGDQTGAFVTNISYTDWNFGGPTDYNSSYFQFATSTLPEPASVVTWVTGILATSAYVTIKKRRKQKPKPPAA